jgi:two-component system phosphate regulon sensor histidine kinase PhoR
MRGDMVEHGLSAADPSIRPPQPAAEVPTARATALRATALTSGCFILVALADGHLSGWLLAALGAALGLTLLFFRGMRPAAVRASAQAPTMPTASLLETVVALLPDPVIVVDFNREVTHMSRAAMALYPGLRKGEPLSYALRAPDVLEGLGQALESNTAQSVELVERVPVEQVFAVTIVPLPGEGAEAQAAMLHLADLTEARRLEHMRVDFVANASHELRTPLASVVGFIDTLQGPARNDAAARERFLGVMREQAGRMARLIDDLLSLSRIELSAHVQPGTVVDLLPIVRHIAETLSPLAADNKVTIAIGGDKGPLPVKGDRDELLRVFENLIENAVKYGQSGGRVDVLVERQSQGGRTEAQVTVRDYGPGIAPEHVPRLTERFYRVDVSTSRQKGGTGLGLAIVKHIVNRHRGRLSIESQLGQGATFRVAFPLVSDQP